MKIGDVIAGKYRVRAILGRQRGFLVEAIHTELDQRVVLRVLSPSLVDDKEVERFRREARVLSTLASDHVARIIDVGRTEDGGFFLARQHFEGQDLQRYLDQRGALPLAEAALFILQAAEAVAETHAHGIVLRELRPSHLFLTQRMGGQQIKIIDFGTAKLMRDPGAPGPRGELTATATLALSCSSSPELVRRDPRVDGRTDVWSLGAILYQLLTARPPFAGEAATLMLAITRDDPVPVTRWRPDLPPEIDSIVGWALAKDPAGRFADVHGFAHALLPFAPPEGQILVRRIGEITAAGRRRREEAPVAVDREDKPAPPLDRTVLIGPGASPGHAEPAPPVWQPMPVAMEAPAPEPPPPPPPQAAPAVMQASRGQQVALAVVGAAVVLLAVIAALVIVRRGATPAAVETAASTTASAAPPIVPVASAPAVAVADGVTDEGTLVAVAVGGSCAFSVNGASKGTTSTLKLSVKPGTYSVMCAPPSGASRSKTVTVGSGETATAMFQL